MTLVMHRSDFSCSQEALFAFHQDVRNLARISPPFPRFRLVGEPGPTVEGDRQAFVLGFGPVKRRWEARVTHVIAPRLLEDVQVSGPFRRWRHQHRCAPTGPATSTLTDVISFRLAPTPAGPFLDWLLVRPMLIAMLRFRHARTRRLLGGASR
jgi:ligand-binding SRPBCC domain-containing protein